MQFPEAPPPFWRGRVSVPRMMRRVLAALIPGAIAHVWFFGPGLLLNFAVAAFFCLLTEALMLKLRGQPLGVFIPDLSAVVTASLIAFALPPLTPWWVTATACVFGIAVAKHLYGGLGYNLFNPAMAGYVAVIIAFPEQLAFWLAPAIGDINYVAPSLGSSLSYLFTGSMADGETLDTFSRATPLDSVKVQLGLMQTMEEIRTNPLFGDFGGRGWEWVNTWVAVGGLWLMYVRIIRWEIPVATMLGVVLPAMMAYALDPATHPSPWFHLMSGGTILCAFFVATDPVTAATSNRGRLIYAGGIGVLIWVIRQWGSYSDGASFAVLLMNLAVPLIDRYTVPRPFGHASPGDNDTE